MCLYSAIVLYNLPLLFYITHEWGKLSHFFFRKGRYSINLQLICDDKRRIIFYVIGFPGSMYDGDVLSQSPLHKYPEDFLSMLEYIIADAGYGTFWWLCTPYKNPYAQIEYNRVFNQLFSSGRVKIEHTNGIVKNRFASLKGLSHQIKKREHFERVMRWILSILNLHNMLISFRDEWEDEDAPEETEEEAAAYHASLPLNTTADGSQLRIRVQTDLLHWFYNRL